MATWTPSLAVFDDRSIKSNLIDHIDDNQADALAWASPDEELPAIAAFYPCVRTNTSIFPALTFIASQRETDYGDGDIVTIQYQQTIQLAVIHGDQDTLTNRSTMYAMALESMLANAPKTTFTENSYILDMAAGAVNLVTVFDVQGRLNNNKYIQLTETTATWTLYAKAYAEPPVVPID